jgi:hypothetical protein
MSTAGIVVLVIVLLAVLFAAGWFFGGQARSRRLRNRFGPEYDRRLEETDNRKIAERDLAAREKRHAQLALKPLSDSARSRYTARWTEVQEQFVDQPVEAVAEADELVHAVMRERGYPMEGFDQQAADLSVEHAGAVSNYRDAYAIRARHAEDGAEKNTEDLRVALVHYRSVFDELVGATHSRTERTEDHATPAARERAEAPADAPADKPANAPTDAPADQNQNHHLNNR